MHIRAHQITLGLFQTSLSGIQSRFLDNMRDITACTSHTPNSHISLNLEFMDGESGHMRTDDS
jgi:hypothetical protein